MGMPGNFVSNEGRWRNDNGNEGSGGASFKESANIAHDFPTGELDVNVRLRWVIEAQSGDVTNGREVKLQYEVNSSATWNDVNGSSSVARSSGSANLTDGEDCSEHGVSQDTGTGWANTGDNDGVDEADGIAGTATTNLLTDEYYIVEFCFQIREADVSNNDSIAFRLVRSDDDSLFTTLTEAVATIDLPSSDVFHDNRVDAISHQQQPSTESTLGGVLIE
jgi:hypothetical protein